MIDETRSSIHDWINSAGVVVAMVSAAVSMYFAYESDETAKLTLALRSEKVTVTNGSDNCKTNYEHAPVHDLVWVCWDVYISNDSQTTTAIIDWNFFNLTDYSYLDSATQASMSSKKENKDDPFVYFPPLMTSDEIIVNDSTSTLLKPNFVLKSGEVKTATIQAKIMIPDSVKETITKNLNTGSVVDS